MNVCKCGFRSALIHKFSRHQKECKLLNPQANQFAQYKKRLMYDMATKGSSK